MRIISEFETQFKLGQESLNKIKLDYKSRDDITKLLLGIQHISDDKKLMAQIFQILKEKITIKSIGRSGMSLWKILILGLLRQVINADYDRLCNLANNHIELIEIDQLTIMNNRFRQAQPDKLKNIDFLDSRFVLSLFIKK